MAETAETTETTETTETNRPGKREDCIGWDEFFMGIAVLAAKRSKDPDTQVGACIVDKYHHIIGVGYNGMPNGCSDDSFSWAKRQLNPSDNKHLYVCHAEVNAILNKNTATTDECKMYVTLFPCNECAKFVIQSRIKEVIYIKEKEPSRPEGVAARKMFDAAGVRYQQYESKNRPIVLDV